MDYNLILTSSSILHTSVRRVSLGTTSLVLSQMLLAASLYICMKQLYGFSFKTIHQIQHQYKFIPTCSAVTNTVEPLLSGHQLTESSIYQTSWTVKKLFCHSHIMISNMASSGISSPSLSSDVDVSSKKCKRKIVFIKKLEICRKSLG